jgi:hypothetical protein
MSEEANMRGIVLTKFTVKDISDAEEGEVSAEILLEDMDSTEDALLCISQGSDRVFISQTQWTKLCFNINGMLSEFNRECLVGEENENH